MASDEFPEVLRVHIEDLQDRLLSEHAISLERLQVRVRGLEAENCRLLRQQSAALSACKARSGGSRERAERRTKTVDAAALKALSAEDTAALPPLRVRRWPEGADADGPGAAVPLKSRSSAELGRRCSEVPGRACAERVPAWSSEVERAEGGPSGVAVRELPPGAVCFPEGAKLPADPPPVLPLEPLYHPSDEGAGGMAMPFKMVDAPTAQHRAKTQVCFPASALKRASEGVQRVGDVSPLKAIAPIPAPVGFGLEEGNSRLVSQPDLLSKDKSFSPTTRAPSSSSSEAESVREADMEMNTLQRAAQRRETDTVRFLVLDCWNKKKGFRKAPVLTRQMSKLSGAQHSQITSAVNLDSEGDEKETLERWELWVMRFILPPSCAPHVVWEVLGLILVLFDIAFIPLQAFDPPTTAFTTGAVWFIRFFWTFDIPLAFLTGFVSSTGSVEMRPMKVAKEYARTRLPLDLLIVGADWLEFFAQALQIITMFRVIRLVRLARLAKARKLTEFVLERIRSERVMLTSAIMFVLFVLLLLIHVVTCVWYFIQEMHQPEGSLAERYVKSYHNVLALFMGEQLEPGPETMGERVFTLLVLVFAFVVSASFVGSLTTAMTRLQIIASQRSSQFAGLSRYLSDYGVSRELSVRVQRNARHALREQHRKTPESSVELLALISDPLRAEIHYEVHAPVLTTHPFFRIYNGINAACLRHICHTALTAISLSRGDVLFSEFEVSVERRMYFISGGKFTYTQNQMETAQLESGLWVAEAVLWTTWSHRGSLRALSECRLLALDAGKFAHIVSTFPTQHVYKYAAKFVEELNSLSHGDLGELTDVGDEDQSRRWASSVFYDDGPPRHRTSVSSRVSFLGMNGVVPTKRVSGICHDSLCGEGSHVKSPVAAFLSKYKLWRQS